SRSASGRTTTPSSTSSATRGRARRCGGCTRWAEPATDTSTRPPQTDVRGPRRVTRPRTPERLERDVAVPATSLRRRGERRRESGPGAVRRDDLVDDPHLHGAGEPPREGVVLVGERLLDGG